MSRRIWTLATLFVPLVALVVVGFTVHVPFVSMGPGPTFNTLGDVQVRQDDGEVTTKPVVQISGPGVDPTSGHLNMTTVAVRDHLTLFDALGLWASGDDGVVPREDVFAPGKTDEQIDEKNAAAFAGSEQNAKVAALGHLGMIDITVAEVTDGSGAEGVLEKGDVITAVDGEPVSTSADLVAAIAHGEPGDTVRVTFRRGGPDGPEHTAPIVLDGPDDPSVGPPVMGVQVRNEGPDDLDITFHLEDVGGPSAGLMFSLAVVDKLSPGELSGDRFVAGTGTISPSGAVGPIGGIPYKMRAARNAGATVFLVPERNCSEAVRHAPDGLDLVKVTSLDDAVSGLEDLDAGEPAPSC